MSAAQVVRPRPFSAERYRARAREAERGSNSPAKWRTVADPPVRLLRVIQPFPGWRCKIWFDQAGDCWNWEARRFGRFALHVSGECAAEMYARRVAVAAALALRNREPLL